MNHKNSPFHSEFFVRMIRQRAGIGTDLGHMRATKRTLIVTSLVFILGLPLYILWHLNDTVTSPGLLDVGTRAPSFDFETLQGTPYDPGSVGRSLTLLVFFRTDCAHCLRELESLRALGRKIEAGLRILAVSESDLKSTADIVESPFFGLTVLVDEKKTFLGKFKGKAVPATYIIDKENIIRYRELGYQGPDELESAISLLIDKQEHGILTETERIDAAEALQKSPRNGLILATVARDIAFRLPDVNEYIRGLNIEENSFYENIILLKDPSANRLVWLVRLIASAPSDSDSNGSRLVLIDVEMDGRTGEIINVACQSQVTEDELAFRYYQDLYRRYAYPRKSHDFF